MEIEDRDKVEAEVRQALSQVRLVFELGFPEDLTKRAREVVISAKEGGRLIKNSEIRYPACWVLNIVNIARNREGRGFWNGEATEELREPPHGLTPSELAKRTVAAFKSLGLETFEEIVLNEGALTNLTPIFMHSGIPLNNIPELVQLIDKALTKHRIGADEQIRDWTRSKNGFGQLWQAAKILLKSGGAIASDLLERINEVIIHPERALETGLPADLVEALRQASENRQVTRRGTDNSLPKPYIYLDPYSCLGPTLMLPTAPTTLIDEWRVTGSERTNVRVRPHENAELPLNPKDEYEVTGYLKGDIVTRRIIHAYRDLPIQFFKSSNGRLIERRGTQIDVSEGDILAIHHQKITSSAFSQTENFPMQSGKWGEWKISSVDLELASSIALSDGVRNESIQITRAPIRPHLVSIDDSLSHVTSRGLPVYSVAPKLAIETGSIDPSLIRVVIESDGTATETPLSDLPRGGQISLENLMKGNGIYSVRVTGPIGFGMPTQQFVLIQNLEVVQEPRIVLPHQPIVLTVKSADTQVVRNAPRDTSECDVEVFGMGLTIRVTRATWAVRTKEQLSARLETELFNIGIDQLQNSSESYLSIDTGLSAYIEVGVAVGTAHQHIDSPSQRSNRRTLDLAMFADTVRQSNSEKIDVQIRVDNGSWLNIGRITATYSAVLSDFIETKTDAGHQLSAQILENRPFKNRVVRFWPLDRPWDQSFKISLNDESRNSFLIDLPNELKSGAYRVGVRIEDPWTPEPPRPRRNDVSAFDISIEHGLAFNMDDPVDRLILAIKFGTVSIETEDVKSHGHVIISLLDQLYRDEGVQGLMGQHAARAYNFLERDASGIVQHIVRALQMNLLERDSRVAISLAIMPNLFKIEDEEDLSIPDDVEELVWSEIPWIAAILEPWDDQSDAPQLWARHLGWPELQIQDDDAKAIEGNQDDDSANENRQPTPREILIENFDQYVRRYLELDLDFWALVLDGFIGSLSDLPLSRDSEFLAIVATIPKAQQKRNEILEWREQWSSTISTAHGYLKRESNRHLLDQYDVPAAWLDHPYYKKWILKDVVAVADYAVLARSSSSTATQALIAIYEHLPEWVSYSLLLALSLAPYNRKRQD